MKSGTEGQRVACVPVREHNRASSISLPPRASASFTALFPLSLTLVFPFSRRQLRPPHTQTNCARLDWETADPDQETLPESLSL